MGDELLDEVCGDLQERIQHIKAVLGEQPALSGENISFLTMNNKAPFWNEASQVFQVCTPSIFNIYYRKSRVQSIEINDKLN